jgi:hypothetical protein
MITNKFVGKFFNDQLFKIDYVKHVKAGVKVVQCGGVKVSQWS